MLDHLARNNKEPIGDAPMMIEDQAIDLAILALIFGVSPHAKITHVSNKNSSNLEGWIKNLEKELLDLKDFMATGFKDMCHDPNFGHITVA